MELKSKIANLIHFSACWGGIFYVGKKNVRITCSSDPEMQGFTIHRFAFCIPVELNAVGPGVISSVTICHGVLDSAF